MIGTGAIYSLSSRLSPYEVSGASWFAFCPGAVVYWSLLFLTVVCGNFLFEIMRYEKNAIEEPPSSKLSCSIALVGSLLTQFIALAHSQQTYECILQLLNSGMKDFSMYRAIALSTAFAAWMCYLAAVCLLELESYDMYLQSRKRQEVLKYY